MSEDKKNKKIVSIIDIDRAVEGSLPGFTLQSLTEKLGQPGDDDLKRRLERILDSDDRFFHNSEEKYESKDDFFENITFAVTPEQWEIEQGVLFPANRLIAFLTQDIFPSDADIFFGEKEIPKKEITLPFREAMKYCLLVGSEQLVDYMEADSDANAGLRRHGSYNSAVTLTVFDCAALYKELDFHSGDALILRLTDREEGIFQAEYRKAADRDTSLRGKWILDFENAMAQVVKEFRDYMEIPEQLAWGFYFAGKNCSEAEASIDEFIAESDRIYINNDGDHSVLALRDEGDAEDAAAAPVYGQLPEGFSISSGETSDLGTMLREIGSSLTPQEIDGFILDNCAARDMEFDRFFARAFPHQISYADDAQEAVFLNFMEERFEELTMHYNRVGDEKKAPLRSTIMELVEDRMEQEQHPHNHNGDEECCCHDSGRLFAALNSILEKLNSESFDPDDDELDQLQVKIENTADQLEKLWD